MLTMPTRLHHRPTPKCYHGQTGTKTFYIWAAMIQRCKNPNCKDYKNYGGRGIGVCDRWLCFENFIKDMGQKPEGLMLGRRDNDGPYSPENCRWETRTDQNRNRRWNRRFTINGINGCMIELCEHFKISIQTVSSRIHRDGWSPEKAFLTSVHH